MLKLKILMLTVTFSSLHAMVLFNRESPDDVAARLIVQGDDYEKAQAKLFLEARVSGPTFLDSLKKIKQIKERRKLQAVQLTREQKTDQAINALRESVAQGPDQVRAAFKQVDEIYSQYSWYERSYGAGIINNPENIEEGGTYDRGLAQINNTEGMAHELFSNIVRSCRGPLCGQVIREVQSRYDIRAQAQDELLHDPRSLLFANPDVLNAFLALGVKPYLGWNVAGDYVAPGGFMFGGNFFSESQLCASLLPNSDALKVFIKHFPSFATAALLHKIVKRDQIVEEQTAQDEDTEDEEGQMEEDRQEQRPQRIHEQFRLLKQMAPLYGAIAYNHPNFPHACIEQDEIELDNLAHFIEWAAALFDLNYRHKSAWWGWPQTVLDIVGYKMITAAETMPNEERAKHVAAINLLLGNGDSANPTALVKAAKEKAELFNGRLTIYRKTENIDPVMERQMRDRCTMMDQFVIALRQRFKMQEIQPVVIVVQ